VELPQQFSIQNICNRNPAPLLRSIPLPLHEVLKAPHPTPQIHDGMKDVPWGLLDVQRGRRDLTHLRFLERTRNHRPEERHMERWVNTIIRGKL
jgi:hypothetical protein